MQMVLTFHEKLNFACFHFYRRLPKCVENLPEALSEHETASTREVWTLESVKQQVSNLLNSPARERMIQMANQRRQASKPPLVVPVEPVSQNAPPPPLQLTPWTKKAADANADLNTSLENELVNDLFNIKSPSVTMESFSEKGYERLIPSEIIMKQLAREVMKGQRFKEVAERAKAAGLAPPKESDIPMKESLRMELVNMKEVEGNLVITYNEGGGTLLAAPELEEKYNIHQLRELLLSDSNRYKHCILHRKEAYNYYATVLDSNSHISSISINNSARCSKGFHGDEVVVEILQPDVEDMDEDNAVGVKVQGRVVGILQRHIDPQNKLFICTVDLNNPGIMIPINAGIPKMYNLVTQAQVQRTKKGNVSVYEINGDNEVTFNQYVKIDPNSLAEKLFVVRYLDWDSRFRFPVGIVIGVMQAGVKVNTGMSVLNVEHGVKKNYRPETEAEVQNLYPPAYNLPASEYSQCLDFRAKWTFSINAKEKDDIPVALSIEEMNDGNYVIGVHAADVAHHVIKGSNIDKEALDRGYTLRPLKDDAYYMLPPKLAADVLSLKPGVDRLTLSIFLTVSKTGDILQAMPKRCVINSKQNFSFEDVEQILHDPNAASDYLKSCVIVLYHISRIWRRQRLGNASMYQDIHMTEKLSPEAHLMYQELMINTNHHVGRLLLENFPDISPLHCQASPNVTELENWKRLHSADAINSVALTKPFLEGSKTCTCKVACTCIINYIRMQSIKIKDAFDIYQVVWNTVCQAADVGDVSFIQNIITAAESHPQLAVALVKLKSIQSVSTYVCSSQAIDKTHYSLNLAPYVSFTNPLSSYIDICAHRLITAVVENGPIPYTQEEIVTVCQKFTHNSRVNMDLEDAVRSLHLSAALKSKPLSLNPIVESIKDDVITLCFPSLPHIPESKRSINISLLNPSEKPMYDEATQSSVLKWKERIYDPTAQVTEQENGNGMVDLSPNRFIFKIPSFQWQKLLISVREENQEKTTKCCSGCKGTNQRSCSGRSVGCPSREISERQAEIVVGILNEDQRGQCSTCSDSSRGLQGISYPRYIASRSRK